MEVARRVRVGEHRSDVESELTSDDPTDLDNMVFSDTEGSQEVVKTSAERRDPAATSAGEEQEAARRAEVPAARKRAASADAVGERAVKWTQSLHLSAVSPIPLSPVADAAEGAGRSEERTGARAATLLVPMSDLQPEEGPPTVGAVE